MRRPAGLPLWASVAVADGELLWRTGSGTLLDGDGEGVVSAAHSYATLKWQLSPFTPQVRRYLDVSPEDPARAPDFVQRGYDSVLRIAETLLVTTSTFPGNDPRRYLVLIDLDAGTLHRIETVASLENGVRGPVAIQRGPFALVRVGAASCLHVRGEPSIVAASLDCAAEGVLLRRTGAEVAGWLPVATPAGAAGWASAAFLEFER